MKRAHDAALHAHSAQFRSSFSRDRNPISIQLQLCSRALELDRELELAIGRHAET